MDDADRAQLDLERQIAAAAAAVRPAPSRLSIHCLGCGEPIPQARRAALPGCCLCIHCQTDAERAMGR